MRREALLAGLLCVAGAFLVLVAAGRGWAVVEVAASPLLPATRVQVSGAELAPGLRALGLVGLAGVPALVASRGRGRTVVGLVLSAAGAAVVAVAARLAADRGALVAQAVREADAAAGSAAAPTAWPVLAVLGGLLLLGAGLLAVARGRRWSALGRAYDAPAARAPAAPTDPAVAERALWEALDRGEDPTGTAPGPDEAADPAAR